MSSNLTRFTDRVVSLAQKDAIGELDIGVQKGDGGYAHLVIIAIHGPHTSSDHRYQWSLAVLPEMHRTITELGREVSDLPNFATVCIRKQGLEILIWRVTLRLSDELHYIDNIQVIDAAGRDRIAASPHNTDESYVQGVKTTTLIDCKRNPYSTYITR